MKHISSPEKLTRILCLALLAIGIAWLSVGSNNGIADEVRLKNGLLIEGKPVPLMGLDLKSIQAGKNLPTQIYPVLMIDTGLARYFVPEKQKAGPINRAAGLASRFETFTFERRTTGRGIGPTQLGSVLHIGEFDEHGRRTVRLKTERGETPIVVGAKEIGPKHISMEGINYVWEHSIATSEVNPDKLDAMLRTLTDPTDPKDRLRIAAFYLQAGHYIRAGDEVDKLVRDFPDYKARGEQIGLQIRQRLAQYMLDEIRTRMRAGQHRLAMIAIQKFPRRALSAAVTRTVTEIATDYARRNADIERAKLLLGEFQAELDAETREQVAPMRSELRDGLNFNTLPRLDAFLKLADDGALSVNEKLALAYSGWVLGSAQAETELRDAINLWNAKFLVREYLRSDNPLDQRRLLTEVEAVEGMSAARLLKMIPYLPPSKSAMGIEPGQVRTVQVGTDESPATYSVLLPREYSPDRSYPMVVALRPGGWTPEQTLNWWGGSADRPGQSQRLGYIVISPHYGSSDQQEYEYTAKLHNDVLASIRDARKRFSVDSDRVFMAGHGMGGDAAFDIGMSKPQLFAGITTVCGICDGYCKWYWKNALHVPLYVVGGELDRNSMSLNASVFNRMMKAGYKYDIVYAEYLGRGFETYAAERERIFDWMEARRRVKWVKEFENPVLRPTENAYYWMEAFGLPAKVTAPTTIARNGQPVIGSPVLFKCRITPGNSIYLMTGADSHTVWLSPELVNLEERVQVKINGRTKHNDFVKPNIPDILEDLGRRGDRQKVYSIKLGL